MNRLFSLWSKGNKPDKERRNGIYRSPRPLVGQFIACRHVMVKVTAPLGVPLWEDLMALGWRTVDPVTDRRSYAQLPPDAFDDILFSDREHLVDTHRALLLQKPHPLGLDQPRPNESFRGLPTEVHWQGGYPTLEDIQIDEQDELPGDLLQQLPEKTRR